MTDKFNARKYGWTLDKALWRFHDLHDFVKEMDLHERTGEADAKKT